LKSAVIPVSFMEEEKEFLGLMSIRQILIIGPTVLMIYIWITAVPIPFINLGNQIMIKLFSSMVIAGLAGTLSFYYMDRYEMYFDKYIRIRWTFYSTKQMFYYFGGIRGR
jgi:hypothetical protein